MSEPVAALPPAPSLVGALRAGAIDWYQNSWRVVPATILLAAGIVGVAAAAMVLGSLVAAALAGILAWPLAGLVRLGAMATRGRDVNLSDVADPVRRDPWRLLATGLALSGAGLLLVTNVVLGLALGGVLPWIVATAAGWGLAALALFSLAAWPLLVDPVRETRPWRDRLRLAGLLVLAHPGRLAAMAALLAIALVASGALVVALLTVAPGYVALVACRFVLPAADRLEARLAAPIAA